MIDRRDWSPRTTQVYQLLIGSAKDYSFKEIAEYLGIRYWNETVDTIKIILFPLLANDIIEVWRSTGRGKPYMVRRKQ